MSVRRCVATRWKYTNTFQHIYGSETCLLPSDEKLLRSWPSQLLGLFSWRNPIEENSNTCTRTRITCPQCTCPLPYRLEITDEQPLAAPTLTKLDCLPMIQLLEVQSLVINHLKTPQPMLLCSLSCSSQGKEARSSYTPHPLILSHNRININMHVPLGR